VGTTRFRPLRGDDFTPIGEVFDDWWGGRPLRRLLLRPFFDHFADTSLVAERDGEMAGFLIGFMSSARPGEAYIHLVGVAPPARGSGVGRELYERFFAIARGRGCDTVRAITAPSNRGSIAFHRSMGFELEPSDRHADGVPVHAGHDVEGADRVLFVKTLE
jgi:ribosomal protein S18 acetylase RimI-like enzyme